MFPGLLAIGLSLSSVGLIWAAVQGLKRAKVKSAAVWAGLRVFSLALNLGLFFTLDGLEFRLGEPLLKLLRFALFSLSVLLSDTWVVGKKSKTTAYLLFWGMLVLCYTFAILDFASKGKRDMSVAVENRTMPLLQTPIAPSNGCGKAQAITVL